MSDLTLLYYTCHRISHGFAGRVRRALAAVTTSPIVAISQNGTMHDDLEISADFSNRLACQPIHVEAPPSIAQVYRNVLLAAQHAETEFVAFCEDDTLYVADHFSAYRPLSDVFAYNEHRLVLTRTLATDGRSRGALYFENPRTQMALGLCARTLLIETLTERFAKHPNPPLDTTIAKKAGVGEPGRYEKNLGLPRRKFERFKWSTQPNITINHALSLMGRRAFRPDMPQFYTVEPWGDANDLWRRIHG